MTGLDQFIVALWFLPVALFIVLPLSIACAWGLISFVASPFRQAATPRQPMAAAESAAG